MEISNVFGAILIAGCVTSCTAQFRDYLNGGGWSDLLGRFGFGVTGTHQQNTSPGPYARNENQIFSMLANRWDGVQDLSARRLEDRTEYVNNRAKATFGRVTNTIQRTRDQWKQQQRRWDQYPHNNLRYDEDYIDDRVENRVDRVEDIYGDNVAESLENLLENVQESVEGRSDKVKDAVEDRWGDWFDDRNDNDRYDWDDNDERNIQGWSNYRNNWSDNQQHTNIWQRENENDHYNRNDNDYRNIEGWSNYRNNWSDHQHPANIWRGEDDHDRYDWNENDDRNMQRWSNYRSIWSDK